MVLFLCIFSGVLALIVCLLWRVKIRFCAELNDTHLYARAKLCLLFGLVKIPMDIDTNIIALLRKSRKNLKKKSQSESSFFISCYGIRERRELCALLSSIAKG